MRLHHLFVAVPFLVVMLCLGGGCDDSDSVTGTEPSPFTFVERFSVDPLATYLHVCSNPADPWFDDGALDTAPILLADYGLAPGDSLRFEVIGDFINGNNTRSRMIAVFSSTATLLGGSEIYRVPGAIDAGEDYATVETYGCGGEQTDIPEDFYCTPEVYVTVPAGATHLFFCARDSYYEDNTDAEGDFGMKIYKYEP